MSSKSRKSPTIQVFTSGAGQGEMGSFKEVPMRSQDIFWRRLQKMMLTPSNEQAIRRARRRIVLIVGIVVVPVVIVGTVVLLVLR